MTAPVLVAAAHGTRDGRDRPTVEALLARVRALRPGIDARATYLQFTAPSVTSALIAAGGPAVVVPLLLSTGYHLRADLPAAIYQARNAIGSSAQFALAPALGPHPLLADALLARLDAAGWAGRQALVLAAAGSTDPRAIVDVRMMAGLLAARTRVQVAVGFAAGTSPTVAQSVARLRQQQAGGVAVASYLIAAGQFHDVAVASGADQVAAPLADHPALARLVLHRYDVAARSLTRPSMLARP
jgi:sirohydrochlorin ferrochelatase